MLELHRNTIQQIAVILLAALFMTGCKEKPLDEGVPEPDGADTLVVCPADSSTIYGTVTNLGKPLKGVKLRLKSIVSSPCFFSKSSFHSFSKPLISIVKIH